MAEENIDNHSDDANDKENNIPHLPTLAMWE
jgi:hypothetical protein